MELRDGVPEAEELGDLGFEITEAPASRSGRGCMEDRWRREVEPEAATGPFARLGGLDPSSNKGQLE
jgi:hypothetical protein